MGKHKTTLLMSPAINFIIIVRYIYFIHFNYIDFVDTTLKRMNLFEFIFDVRYLPLKFSINLKAAFIIEQSPGYLKVLISFLRH